MYEPRRHNHAVIHDKRKRRLRINRIALARILGRDRLLQRKRNLRSRRNRNDIRIGSRSGAMALDAAGRTADAGSQNSPQGANRAACRSCRRSRRLPRNRHPRNQKELAHSPRIGTSTRNSAAQISPRIPRTEAPKMQIHGYQGASLNASAQKNAAMPKPTAEKPIRAR